uniref:RAD54 like 2 n=1 Tax=Salmo trutta TaxID=8032 RepID=A0A674CJQ5_SALTR
MEAHCLNSEEEDENDGDDEDDVPDQPHSAPFSSENEAQGGGSARWQCTAPSTSPSGGTPSSRPESHTPSRSLRETKKSSLSYSNKPAHMRRNIRKLLREHQLEAVTKAAQQEELERRQRLEQQGKEGHFPVPLLPEYILNVSPFPSTILTKTLSLFPFSTIDVIELSSDEDEALQISSESTNEEEEDRSAAPEATGAHANDAVNQPDAQGRVLVNLNHPTEEADLFLSPQLARVVKPHQIGGIRFLYDNLVESLERYESSGGLGCILAHSMGLGKTLQVISFIDIVLRHTQAHTVLAIVPVNTLQNWLAEFNLWVPTFDALPVDVDPTQVSPLSRPLWERRYPTPSSLKVISDWSRDGGVLLMGYEMYRLLSLKKSFVAGRKKSKKAQGPVVIDLDEEDRHQELLKGIEKALSRPGPDLVICDEGHRIKNCHASTSQALKNIRTRRRVVLTGYPLQNNLIEYWCMVDFVRPDFLGTRQEFSNMFERPILNGQCVDSTPQDVQLMRYRSHVLHSLLEGFVQRRGHDVLRDQLPSKDEHVILVRLSPLQRALYTEFMNRFREAGNSGWLSLNPLKAFCVCCKIWNHTDVLYEALQKENLANEQDLDLDDMTNSHARCPAPNQKGKTPEDPNSIGGLSLNALQEKANQVITYEWAKEIMSDYKPGILENSAKMVLLFHLIDESVRKGDKILVFSQSLSTLSVIEEFLAKRPIPAGSAREGNNQNWLRNHNYYRLDGSTSASERERLINQFNDPSNTSTLVFLLSTRAGCLGVNLIGANRVVVFDASWNPCHDAQAVCRVYRYGQKKPCHIYRLVCDFTLEKKIYDRQISKQGMSDRVVDDLNPMLSFTRREVESLLHFVEEEPDVSQVQLQSRQEMEASIRQACQLYPHLVTKFLILLNCSFNPSALNLDCQFATLSSFLSLDPPPPLPPFRRPPPRQDEKAVASIRPVQSTPIPMLPRQASHASASTADSDSSSGFPVNYLQKAGVFVQKIVTTTDIVIPGTNSSTDVKARISAGESIHVIRGTKGTYIRTCDGRIFAIRAASKLKAGEENSAVAPKSNNPNSTLKDSTNGPSGCVTRPLSPDSPEILSELQRYTAAAGNKIQQQQASKAPSAGSLETALAESTNGSSMTSHAKPWGETAAQPNTDYTAALDLKSTKRKASTPSADEWANNKQLATGKRTSAPLPPRAFPFTGGYGLPPMVLNPAMLGSIEQPLFMGAGSPYFQPHSQLGDPCLMFPMTSDHFGQGDGTLLSSSSRSSSSTTTSSSSAASDSASLAPFMLGAGMAGMLSYGQSVGMYPSSLLPGGLPAATPGPAGSSFLSHFPSSDLMGAGLGRSDAHGSAENAGSSSDSDDDDDDDVIEVTGQ